MLFGRHGDTHPQLFDLREIQFGRYTHHHAQELGVRQRSVQLPYYAHYTLVTQMFKREIDQVEVYPFQVHTGGRNHLATLLGRVAETGDRRIRRKAIELVYRLDSANFRKGLCHRRPLSGAGRSRGRCRSPLRRGHAACRASTWGSWTPRGRLPCQGIHPHHGAPSRWLRGHRPPR